jgi:hypothetical protein
LRRNRYPAEKARQHAGLILQVMTTRIRSRLLLVAAAGIVAAGLLPVAAGAATTPTCGITWGSLAKSAPQGTEATVAGVRTGRHDCYDRMVIDLAGRPAAGYDVRYIDPPFRADGSGDPLFVAGGAVLQVVVRAPAYDAGGQSTVPWPSAGHPIVRPDQFDAGGFRTFEDLVWGGSFEGQSSFGLGIRARLPFRVLQLDGPGDGTRLVVDVAHRW